jgi:hypothetical protein
MIRFLLCLLGALFNQAAVMGRMNNSETTDFFASFGEDLRASVEFDTEIVKLATALVRCRVKLSFTSAFATWFGSAADRSKFPILELRSLTYGSFYH